MQEYYVYCRILFLCAVLGGIIMENKEIASQMAKELTLKYMEKCCILEPHEYTDFYSKIYDVVLKKLND